MTLDFLPTIGVLEFGAIYLDCPLMSPIVCRFPSIRWRLLGLGLLVEVAALIGASYVKDTDTLIVTQGLEYSIGNAVF